MKLGKREITKFRENYEVQELTDFIQESVRLAVTFDEKDDVKRLRAKWNPADDGNGGFWSIATKRLNDTCPFSDEEFWGEGGSGTVLDYLNNHKMVQHKLSSNYRVHPYFPNTSGALDSTESIFCFIVI